MKQIKLKYFIVALPVIVLSITGIKIYNRLSWTAEPLAHYSSFEPHDSVKQIIVIGDSWAFHAAERGFNEHLEVLLNSGKQIWRVSSMGHCGAKSKEIYEDLVTPTSDFYQFIRQTHPQYALIFCGINDQNGQYGPDYYAHHTCLILKQMLLNDIQPILLELPAWHIEKLYNNYSFTHYLSYWCLNLISTHSIHPTQTLSLYRDALEHEIEKEKLAKKIFFLSWDKFKLSDIWQDDLHLNRKGYQSLAYRVSILF